MIGHNNARLSPIGGHQLLCNGFIGGKGSAECHAPIWDPTDRKPSWSELGMVKLGPFSAHRFSFSHGLCLGDENHGYPTIF
jgi:hypothetical protein